MARTSTNRREILRAELLALFQYATEADIDAQIDRLLAEVLEDDPLAAPLPLIPDDQSEDDRIVITGIGVVSPFGVGVGPFWEGLAAGRSAIGRITRFDPGAFPCQLAGEVPDFAPQEFMDAKEARRMSRSSQLAVAAARMAVDAAGLRIDAGNRDDVGTLIACGTISMPDVEQAVITMVQRGPMKISPFFIPAAVPNMPSSQVAIQLGLRGHISAISTACAASSQAIGEAAEIIRRGDAEVMLAGGAEAPITALSLGAFCVMRALSTGYNADPARASRPFDLGRDGFVSGEGAGVFVLERLSSARRRGAPILAELIGYAATADAYHVTSPDPEGHGAARAMRRALQRARVDPQQVDYINAHATSTLLGDVAETRAIKQVFGEYAHSVPVSAIKSMTDWRGDGRAGLRTVATALGVRGAVWIFQAAGLLFIAVALLPWLAGLAGAAYLLALLPCAVLPTIAVIIMLARSADDATITLALKIMRYMWISNLLPILLMK
ncbi:beta-ketoacyl-ACP synthase II [Oscillochloris sp. ZM17-4]|uniref:beta-ketoacyl-ACP synthase II n=1 Tax=Oscillochloris sp. ZM17-4 TaxID=2866714 RepID=UPI0021068DE0|nr:beta-ketoacyl-ACP synthase II [Oscillochloris sp. ZM17-4]